MGQSFENMTDEDRTGIKERFDHAFDFCYQRHVQAPDPAVLIRIAVEMERLIRPGRA